MKNALTLTLITLMILSLQACIVIQDPGTNANQPAYQDFQNWQKVPFSEKNTGGESEVQRTYSVNFDKIILDIPLEVEIIPTHRQSRIEILAPEKIFKRLLVEKERQTLSLRFGDGATLFKRHQVQFRIYTRQLSSIRVEKGDLIFPQEFAQPRIDILTKSTVKGDFQTDLFILETQETGSYTGIVRGRAITLTARDHSHIEIYGRIAEAQVRAEKSAVIDGKGMHVEQADLQASQNAALIFSADQRVRAWATEQSQITLYGPKTLLTDFTEQGNGRIIVH